MGPTPLSREAHKTHHLSLVSVDKTCLYASDLPEDPAFLRVALSLPQPTQAPDKMMEALGFEHPKGTAFICWGS